MLYHNKHNPEWAAVELVQRANEYAAEHLLRSDNHEHGKPVGGRITATRGEVGAQNLWPAVDAGVLLVA